MNKITEKDQDYVETIQDVNVSTTKVKVIKSKPNELQEDMVVFDVVIQPKEDEIREGPYGVQGQS